jgi:hypothetical protein
MARFTAKFWPGGGVQITCRYQPKGAEPRVVTDYAADMGEVSSVLTRQANWLSAVRPKPEQLKLAYMNLQGERDGS